MANGWLERVVSPRGMKSSALGLTIYSGIENVFAELHEALVFKHLCTGALKDIARGGIFFRVIH